MKLSELFNQNKDIVINSDIDGFLCGMILQKYYGCRIVGFSDSKDAVWMIPEITDLDTPVYIDLYVSRPNVICIEQHIIAYNKELHEQIVGYGTKINPNLERERTFIGDMQSDYYHKYPFGTVHYLIALMAREGITVTFPDLYQDHLVTNPLTGDQLPAVNPGLVVTRADDALYSTLKPYRENALDWWGWLSPNRRYATINQLKDYIDACDINQAWSYKQRIGTFFTQLGCDGFDGAFKSIVNGNGHIQERVINYIQVISGIVGYTLDIPDFYIVHKGMYDITTLTPDIARRALNGPRLYSYAFIYGPGSTKDSFSYTFDMN